MTLRNLYFSMQVSPIEFDWNMHPFKKETPNGLFRLKMSLTSLRSLI